MLKRAEKIIFFLLVFFISSQVGLHLWPDFAYVNGVRIDYLSPILYLIDILLRLLFIIYSIRIKVWKLILKVAPFHSKFLTAIFLLFTLSLIVNIFIAKSPGAHIYGITKILQFGFLGIYIPNVFKKDYIKPFIDTLAISAIVSGVLAFWQFSNQSSVGGLWYFFGERTFNSTTIGISTVNLNEQILRPYAAFPHPNVLAFFLFTVIVFVTLRLPFAKLLQHKIFLLTTLFISTLSLFTTLSRMAIILIIIFSFYEIYSKRNSNLAKISFGLLVTCLGIGAFALWPFLDTYILRGINFRSELYDQAIFMLSQYPLFGIGLNNFFVHQAALVKNISPILFQPPHNIYLLALLSLGVVGFWIFPAIIFIAVRKSIEKLKSKDSEISSFSTSVFIVLMGIVAAGLFDHFFLTLEQGQIVFALIAGLAFAKFSPERFKKRQG